MDRLITRLLTRQIFFLRLSGKWEMPMAAVQVTIVLVSSNKA